MTQILARRVRALVAIGIGVSLGVGWLAAPMPSAVARAADAPAPAPAPPIPAAACTPSEGTTSTEVVGDASGEAGVITDLTLGVAGDLATDGIEAAGSAVLGWLIDYTTGQNGSNPQATIDGAEIDDLNALSKQLSNLQLEVEQLSDAVSADYAELASQLAGDSIWIDYSNSAGATDESLGSIVSGIQNVCQIQNDLLETVRSTELTAPALPSDQVDQLNDIVTYGNTYVNQLDAILSGDSATGTGLFADYAQVLWYAQGGAPSGTLLRGEMLTSMQSFVGSYIALLTQYLNAFAEAAHATPTASGPDALEDFYNDVYLFYVNKWASQWTWNLPALDDAVAIDLVSLESGTSTGPGTDVSGGGSVDLWMTGTSTLTGRTLTPDSPVILGGSDDVTYCATAGLCAVPIVAADGSRTVANSIVRAPLDLSSYLAQPLSGVTGWQVPSSAQIGALVADRPFSVVGAPSGFPTPPPVAGGVGAWASAEDLPSLMPLTYVLAPTGAAYEVVPPVVTTDTQTVTLSATPYAGPVASGSAPGAGYTLGGQVLLVNEWTIAPLPFPAFGDTGGAASTASSRGPEGSIDTQRAPVPAPVTGRATAALGTTFASTTFEVPNQCSDGTHVFTQPDGANAVQVVVAGSGGDSGQPAFGQGGGAAGSGAIVSATIPLPAGANLFAGVGSPLAGTGGGGPGGAANTEESYTGGAGGGLSQISLDSVCAVPLVVAGGGGGGGATVNSGGTGGTGGNGCFLTGCDGASGGPGYPSSSDVGMGGTLFGGGARSGDPYPVVGDGAAPNVQTGGAGGGGGGGYQAGASGGGGGGGWTGGGGGGGTIETDGGLSTLAGGGAGGSSFVASGLTTTAFLGAGGYGKVVITPIVSPDFQLVGVANDQADWEFSGFGVGDDGVTIIETTSATSPDYSILDSLDFDAMTGWTLLGSTFVDVATGTCLSSPDSLQPSVPAVLAVCGSPPPGSTQQFTVIPGAPASAPDALYAIQTTTVTALPFATGVAGFELHSPLLDPTAELVDDGSEPSPPGGTTPPPGDNGEAVPDPSTPAGPSDVSEGHLAATGIDVPWGAALGSVFALMTGLIILIRRRSRGHISA